MLKEIGDPFVLRRLLLNVKRCAEQLVMVRQRGRGWPCSHR